MSHVFDDLAHSADSDTSPPKDLRCIFRSLATRTRHESRQCIEYPGKKDVRPPTVLRGQSVQQACQTVLHRTSVTDFSISTPNCRGQTTEDERDSFDR